MPAVKKSHSSRSFRHSLYALGSLILLYVITALSSATKLPPGELLVVAFFLLTGFFSISGAVSAIKSLKEPSHWKKWGGIAIRCFMFLLFIALTAFILFGPNEISSH